MADFSNVFFAIYNWADEAAVTATSSTSNSVGTGSKTFTVASSTRFFVGAAITVTRVSDPAVWMKGTITSFSTSTGATEIDVDTKSGSGSSITDWQLTLDKWLLGSWESTLPLSNLVDNRLYKPARSTDVSFSSTQFRCDFGGRMPVNSVCGVAHNLSKYSSRWVRFIDVVNRSKSAFGTSTSSDNPYIYADDINVDSDISFILNDASVALSRDDWVVVYSSSQPEKIFYGVVKSYSARFREMVITPKYKRPLLPVGDTTKMIDWVILGQSNWRVTHDSALGSVWPQITSPSNVPWGAWPWQGSIQLLGKDYNPPFVYITKDQFSVYAYSSKDGDEMVSNTKKYYVSDITKFDGVKYVSIYRFSDNTKAMAAKVVSVNVNTSEITVQVNQTLDSGTYYDWVITGTVPDSSTQQAIARFMDLYIYDDNNQDGFVEIGRIVATSGFQPEINMSYGSGINIVDESRQQRSRGGQVFSDIVPRYKQFRINLEWVKTQDMLSNFYELQYTKGTAQPILIILNPADLVNLHRYTLYGTLDKTSDMSWTDSGSDEPYMSINLVFNEWVAE